MNEGQRLNESLVNGAYWLNELLVNGGIGQMSPQQWRIQDFPEGGGVNPPGGREHAKFSRKLHEIERIWTPRRGVRPSRPPRSANAQ